MKKTAKFLISFSLTFLFVFPFVTIYADSHSSHYTHNSWGYGKSFTLRYDKLDSTGDWSSNVRTAVSSWNTSTSANITLTSPASHLIISASWGNTGWFGIAYEAGNIKLNNNTPSVNRTETVVHELGHGLGLGHTDCSSEIMRTYGFTGSAVPQSGDKAGFESRW